MFLIIAPLVAIFITAYMVTYLWYEQGRQITCIAFGSNTELLSQDIENCLLFTVQSTFVFTMYKILSRITAPTRKEGLARSTQINRIMLAFLFFYLVSTAAILLLKAEIFRHPNQDPSSSYSALEITFLVIEALRVSFTVILMIVYVKVLNIYIVSVRGKTSDRHILKARFFKYFFPIVFGLGSIYSHMLLPFYYLQFLRNENADIENPIGSRVIPPITAIFNELLFITLPIMAWTIYQAVGNRHVVVPKQKKRRLSPRLGRSNSMDSRRTLPSEMLIIENPSGHQNPF